MPSSVIKSYFYKPELQILTIVYVSGAVYNYLDVPQEVFDDFRAAFSKGTYLNKNIKPYFHYVKKSDE
ncbi:MAG: KTSC domain-containing protein [Kaistella sp.]